MKTFKRKTFYTAVLAALGAMGAVGTASAVNVNPDGLGQALIYPYYTVRNAGGTYNTYLSVVNTTASTKAVKVRFVEGKNSKEVLDFNLYLSPFDVWTGAVVPVSATDAAQGGKLITADRSCTTPTYIGNESQFVFKNYAYAGVDAEAAGLDRTNEGHFEIIEMGNVTGTITTGIKHVAGVPANCGVLTDAAISAATIAGSGGLSGTASLINVASGTDYGYNPVVLDDFNFVASTWNQSGSILPNLGNVQPKVSKIFDGNNGVVISSWNTLADNAADPVSAVLMHNNVINEFVLDTASLSATDWVVTFPTKSFYVGNDVVVAGVRQNTAARRPFQRNFGVGGACDEVQFTMHDREEATQQTVTTTSPPAPGPAADTLCWEANVITFKNAAGVASNLLGSTNQRVVNYSYQNGWANLAFPTSITNYPNAHFMQTAVGATTRLNNYTGVGTPTFTTGTGQYIGLPTVGFMLQNFVNGNVGTPPVMSSYGGNFDHKNTRLVTLF